MQHPDRYGRSAKSFTAHLTGLCAWLESEGDAQTVNVAVQRWLSGPSPIGDAVGRWARATWGAYAPLHAKAREWIGMALAPGTR